MFFGDFEVLHFYGQRQILELLFALRVRDWSGILCET